MNRNSQFQYRSTRAPQEDFFDKFEKHPIRNVILVWAIGGIISLAISASLFIGALLVIKAIFF